MEQQVKVIYFAPRPAGRSLPDFRTRWRQHGELGMSLNSWTHMTRYDQLDSLTAQESGLDTGGIVPTAEAEVAGIGQIWVRSDAALADVFADPDTARMLPDEVETFGEELGTRLMPTRETVVWEDGPATLTFAAILHRLPGIDRERFSERWRETGAAFGKMSELRRHVAHYKQNRVLPVSEEADGVVELGFASIEDANAFFAEPTVASTLLPSEGDFIDHPRMVCVLTRPNQLYLEEPAPAGANAAS